MSEELGLNLEGATPIDDNAVETEEQVSATAPQEQNTEVETEVEEGTSTDTVPTPFITVPFKHEDVPFTREEAVEWIQIGKKSEDLLKTIRRAAALQGKSEKEFVESFEKAQDDAYRAELEAKFGDDTETIESLMELYNSKKESTVKAAQSELERQKKEQQDNLESRLADEFIELQKEFPDVKDFTALPSSVKKAAADGKNLCDAYLRHLHTENKKIEAAKASADAAKKASGGNLKGTPEGQHSDISTALMQGLYG
jgi:hypothetical protein